METNSTSRNSPFKELDQRSSYFIVQMKKLKTKDVKWFAQYAAAYDGKTGVGCVCAALRVRFPLGERFFCPASCCRCQAVRAASSHSCPIAEHLRKLLQLPDERNKQRSSTEPNNGKACNTFHYHGLTHHKMVAMEPAAHGRGEVSCLVVRTLKPPYGEVQEEQRSPANS
ncbi:hypothetical protein QTO34_010724 [Cnephaeus nilssonii]|uniref:Uncharacterized protein n=1 Tax=Cnephaeus nilssonii TaxID=3371016 RepID=A0AA40HFZ2_CNENI|nr:hypothetical protein QTO34_010724 [Eptesicus nilssonii]